MRAFLAGTALAVAALFLGLPTVLLLASSGILAMLAVGLIVGPGMRDTPIEPRPA
jgi:hypothetical protein